MGPNRLSNLARIHTGNYIEINSEIVLKKFAEKTGFCIIKNILKIICLLEYLTVL